MSHRDHKKETDSLVRPYGYVFQRQSGNGLHDRAIGIWEAFQRSEDLVHSFTLVAPNVMTNSMEKAQLITLIEHARDRATRDLLTHPNIKQQTNQGERALDFSYSIQSDYSNTDLRSISMVVSSILAPSKVVLSIFAPLKSASRKSAPKKFA